MQGNLSGCALNAGIAAVAGTIAARVAMGTVCDWLGPRLGMSFVLLTTSAATFGLALAKTPLEFVMLRFGIGFGLSAFVACQFWTASMFNVKIVGVLLASLLPQKSGRLWQGDWRGAHLQYSRDFVSLVA